MADEAKALGYQFIVITITRPEEVLRTG